MKKSTAPFFDNLSGLKEDILGASAHLLSGAGGDLKQLGRNALHNLLKEEFVSKAEFDALAARVTALESAAHKAGGKAGESGKPKTKTATLAVKPKTTAPSKTRAKPARK